MHRLHFWVEQSRPYFLCQVLHNVVFTDQLIIPVVCTICLFCKALVFSHLREAFLCEARGFSITLGYFMNRTAGAALPDPLPLPAVCVSMWRPNGRQPQLRENWPSLANPPVALESPKLLPQSATFQRKLWKAVCLQLEGKGGCIFSLFEVKRKKAPLDWQRLSYCIIRPGF